MTWCGRLSEIHRIQHEKLLRGERLVLGLCKLRLIFLIKLFFEQRGTMKGSAKQA